MLFLAVAMLPAGVKAQNCDITLPWSENFDSYTTTGGSTMPNCWTRVVSFQASSSNAVVPNFTTYSGHGTVLNFMGQGGSNDGSGVMKIATPLITSPLNNLEISFDVFKNGLTVYLATDLSDATTYTYLGAYSPGWTWNTVEVRTDTLTGAPSSQGYIVFCGNYGASGYSTAYVDNIYVSALNPCERPLEVTVERVGVTSVVLSWTAVTGAQSYNVKYSTSADLSNAAVETVNGPAATLTGLDPATHYYVGVTTNCSETSESDPRTTDFTTQLSCYSIVNLRQVSMGLDAAAFQWDYDVRGNSAVGVVTYLRDLSDPTSSDYEEASSGENYHFFTALDNTHEYLAIFRTICGADTADAVTMPIAFRRCGETELTGDSTDWANDHPLNPFYNYTYSQMMYPASVFYDMDTIRGIALRRHVRPQSVTTTRTISLWLGHTTDSTFDSPRTVTGMTQVANNVSYVLENQEWDTLMFTTPFVYDGTSNVIVTIVDNSGTHTSSSAAPRWLRHDSEWQMHFKSNDDNPYNAVTPPSSSHQMHLPDMRFVGLCNLENPCEPPVMAVGTTSNTTAVIQWTAGSGFMWDIQYRTLTDSAWTTVTGITTEPYTLMGLTPDTRYEVRIGLNCNGQMRYSRTVMFATACDIQHIPFHFTQEDLNAAVNNGGFSSCWNFSQYVYYGHLTFSHRAYLRNADYNQWIMLPAVAEHLSGARLRTWAAVSSPSFVRVGVAGEIDCSDVVWLDTIELPRTNPNTDVSEYIAYFDGYDGTGNRVVLSPIVDNEYSYVYFFDFHIEMAEGCRPVVGLALDEADSNSLTFHWTPVGGATQWLVYVDGVEHGIASTPSYTVNGLNPYTEYEITVRTYCGEGDTSFARSATFLTGCTGVSCSFTVNAVSLLDTGWAGGFMEITSDDRVIGTVRMNSGSTLSRTFMVCGGMPLSFSWYPGNADSICSFTIVDENGEVLFQRVSAQYLNGEFFALDSLCGEDGDDPGPGPGPGPEGIDGVDGMQITLSPNPANGVVTISGVEVGASVMLTDINGREVTKCTVVNGQWTVDVSNLSAGAYFVRIVGDRSTVARKLIVK